MCFMAFAITTFAQFPNPFQPKKVQDAAQTIRVYIWDRPVTDNLTYKGILPDGMQPVTMFSFDGKTPYYTLPSSSQYLDIQTWFTKLPKNDTLIVGAEYVIAYLDKFSWVKPKKIRKIENPTIKMTVAAFNNSSKYVILSVSPRLVYGVRDPSTGNIMLKMAAENKNVTTQTTMPEFTPTVSAQAKDTVSKSKTPPPPVKKKDWD